MSKVSELDRQRIDRAVAAAEQHTNAEIVVVVAARSGAYADVAWGAGTLAAALVLCFVLLADWEIEPIWVVPIVGVAFFAAFLPASWAAPRLVRRRRATAQVDEAAFASFARLGVHKTRGHTGVLVFVSRAERQGRVLTDAGVQRVVPADVRREWRGAVDAVAASFDVGELCAALERIGERAGAYVKKTADDVDELGAFGAADADGDGAGGAGAVA